MRGLHPAHPRMHFPPSTQAREARSLRRSWPFSMVVQAALVASQSAPVAINAIVKSGLGASMAGSPVAGSPSSSAGGFAERWDAAAAACAPHAARPSRNSLPPRCGSYTLSTPRKARRRSRRRSSTAGDGGDDDLVLFWDGGSYGAGFDGLPAPGPGGGGGGPPGGRGWGGGGGSGGSNWFGDKPEPFGRAFYESQASRRALWAGSPAGAGWLAGWHLPRVAAPARPARAGRRPAAHPDRAHGRACAASGAPGTDSSALILGALLACPHLPRLPLCSGSTT